MRIITDTDSLVSFCNQAKSEPYVTLDTEFLRERTYYAKLCLVQMALPGDGEAVLIDPLVEGLSLQPLYDLMAHKETVKVFHAARQDLEIFFVEGNVIPEPLFDTQVAAMVCGFGEQVGYETLVKRIVKANVDKTSRFTDWSRRPLTDAQKTYALADVTHLRVIYEHLAEQLKQSKRTEWVEEELAILSDKETYISRPEDAWRRIKTRSSSPRFLAVVKELAAFREEHAQRKNIPRARIFKDDALLELASTRPKTPEDLNRSRLLLREARKGDIASGILKSIKTAMSLPNDALPKDVSKDKKHKQGNGALSDLLRVLLKARSDSEGVAAKLISSTAELDEMAAGARDIPALKGWRHTVFGEDALKLCNGEIALSASNGGHIKTVKV